MDPYRRLARWGQFQTVPYSRLGLLVLSDQFQMGQYLLLVQSGLLDPSGLFQTVQCHLLGPWGLSGLFRMVQYRRLGRLGQSGLFQMVRYHQLDR